MFGSVTVDDDIVRAFRVAGAIVIKGMFEREEVRELVDGLRANFHPELDGYGQIGFGKSAQVLRRVEDGKLPRYLRMFYEPTVRPVFKRLVELRNLIAGQRPDWAIEPEDGWWTAARFNQYPKGGGWMADHADADYVGSEPPGGFVQPLLFLTERGTDFESGGAYMFEGRIRIDMEWHCKAGDVLVYDGRRRHGVAPIDPYSTEGGLNGRLVAAVTPLRVLQ